MGVFQLSFSKPILCFKITGKLTSDELKQLQATAKAGIENWGKISVMVILENFLGWEKGPGWGDISFASKYDWNIEKMAIVGPPQWQDWVCAFVGKGFRSVATEYFLPTQLKKARKWLSVETES